MHTQIQARTKVYLLMALLSRTHFMCIYLKSTPLLRSRSEQHSTLMFVSLYAFIHIQRLVPGFSVLIILIYPKPNINNSNCRRFSTPVCSLFHVVPISTNDTGESQNQVECYVFSLLLSLALLMPSFFVFLILSYILICMLYVFYLMAHETK